VLKLSLRWIFFIVATTQIYVVFNTSFIRMTILLKEEAIALMQLYISVVTIPISFGLTSSNRCDISIKTFMPRTSMVIGTIIKCHNGFALNLEIAS
jgi:hypothetical protein